ncbi:hypothetical protein E3Q22_04176 [Wallemia mellicola]|uniref:Protein YOP1 n=2 Tax=Wallemia mellicola TaxID=1708541 RepID=A0A4T0U339_9BASI|nr:hypothetical protein WALSEDRAFT_33749 [Wallemia mellicola CBS 633.66]TIB67741.1 hypothetical protein E3Q24_04086 [Wallemia mellicola]EIM19945.1 hypothetical protein WALSEDRAFT_33749 [Wallemia mellicola CBS 633.66]TIB70475.1 hypothetical protein E3Q23_04170 [Wallemia mellicola]TIB74577.1 hypothetical protein E3Q22_04176 [Wallemia mellicola]TIB79375.1 hypothetical protein E3Q21_04130 [Wallemia mellicola]|eukprot:XP_006960083.1 hypothetical protein WALSEDRAFT_33749 [Wallemia mellicola CBS 633.66]
MASAADIQAKLNYYVGQVDKQLAAYPQLAKIESQLGVPKAYVVPGLALLLFLFVFFNIGASFISNLIGFAVPAYYAFLAIESPGHDDDIQWLTYFVVFSFFTFAESLVNIVTYFPFYYLFKIGFTAWLMLPQTKGAKTLYLNVLRPVLFSKNKTQPRGSFTADDLRQKANAATSD